MTFFILGPLHMNLGPRKLPRCTPRQRIVLAALLLERNRILSTERLIDALWPMDPPATARAQVHICVSALRRMLADGTARERIHTVAPGYLLEVPEGRVDLDVFNRLIAAARADRERGQQVSAVSKLHSALRLWRGQPFTDVGSDVIQAAVVGLCDTRLSALEECMDLDLALGRHEAVAHAAAGLVTEHPLRERLRAQQILALYRSGRTADALAAYRRTRDDFVRELGIEPGMRLRELERAILNHDPALAPSVNPAHQKPHRRDVPETVPKDHELSGRSPNQLNFGWGRPSSG
ncbi:AfsR/SARP family transcriptional regulator [Plantactinospora mayteni]|uniref:AfsR/SARP family transcriptional regulator n=1 Tax=Plantactinospora mayteni TaxID=566021 RepID=UPI001945767B|nr:AfsR/SARP family transcriptional regulator [Plantactinospora mayteni]